MRLTFIAIFLAAFCGCANYSDSHLTPSIVSTKPKAVKPETISNSMAVADTTATHSHVSEEFPDFSDPQATSITAKTDSKSTSEGSDTYSSPKEPQATLLVTEGSGSIQSQEINPVPHERDELKKLSKQVTPRFSYLRALRTLPGRLSFDEKNQMFVFWITPDSLISNVNTLLTATDGGQAIFDKISENHTFPNSFEIRGKTIPHLIDQMVGPFKKPSQILQEVHVNKIILIRYSRGVSAHAN